MTEPRPKRLTPEMAWRVSLSIVDDLIKDGHITEDTRDDAAKDIMSVTRYRDWMGGYEIAKSLDERCHWDCDLEMAEILDGFGSTASSEIGRAEAEWAARNSIIPSLPIGSRVILNTKETGEITGIYEHGAAKFLVKIDGEQGHPSSRRVVNFEDAALHAALVGE